MEKHLKDLSASTLRPLLIQEVNKFIECLDTGSTEDLEQKKLRLREIFDLLKEKERNEMPLVWGKNSKRVSDSALNNQHEANQKSELDGGTSIA
jgi:hypothetical protein